MSAHRVVERRKRRIGQRPIRRLRARARAARAGRLQRGAVVRFELAGEGGTGLIEAEPPRERYLELPWDLGARVHVRPRELRVYVDAA
ncbi:MAG: TOBE-like domain-containing protein [Gammaproteobacteria bacterium]|nr:TOBE-like domain-containing protein [Gammaproteobacteria bacterium]